jgi:hypothetical protein
MLTKNVSENHFLFKSADILWTMYEAPWYLCDLHFQKMFNIIQMRVCKSVYTRAGNYFSMSASAYITVHKKQLFLQNVIDEICSL